LHLFSISKIEVIKQNFLTIAFPALEFLHKDEF